MNSLFSYLLLALLLVSCAADQGRQPQLFEKELLFQREGLSVYRAGDLILYDDAFLDRQQQTVPKAAQRIVLSSTTQLVYLEAMGAMDRVIGVPWVGLMEDLEIQARVADGRIVDVAQGGGLDLEKVIALAPDLLFYDPSQRAAVGRIQEMGILCIPFFEYLEDEPLGRVEWLMGLGHLLGKAAAADSVYSSIRDTYTERKQVAAEGAPRVISCSYYQGTWSVACGGSLMARLVSDAGAQYAMSDAKRGSVDLDMEAFVTLIQELDALIILQHGELDRADILSMDERLGPELFEGTQLIYCNTASSDYFGKGILAPEQQLKELVSVFSSEDAGHRYFHIAR